MFLNTIDSCRKYKIYVSNVRTIGDISKYSSLQVHRCSAYYYSIFPCIIARYVKILISKWNQGEIVSLRAIYIISANIAAPMIEAEENGVYRYISHNNCRKNV